MIKCNKRHTVYTDYQTFSFQILYNILLNFTKNTYNCMPRQNLCFSFWQKNQIQDVYLFDIELAHQAKSCVFHNWDIQGRKKNLRAHFQFWIFDMQANMKFLKFETQGKNLWVTVLSTLNQMLTFNIWQWGQILNFNYLACRMKSCINFKNELWSGLKPQSLPECFFLNQEKVSHLLKSVQYKLKLL